MVNPADNSIENLLRDLNLRTTGWIRHEQAEGKIAIFPECAKDVRDWEFRTLAMHDSQFNVLPPDKQLDNNFANRRLVRGDSADKAPMKFEDSVGTIRGD